VTLMVSLDDGSLVVWVVAMVEVLVEERSTEGRSMPSSLEAERAVLGGLMLDPERLTEVSEVLEPDSFYREAHKRLFKLMREMSERGEPTEMVAVVERVVALGSAEAFGGLSYLSALPDEVPSTENLLYYAGVVRDRAVRRRLLVASQDLAGRIYQGEDELDELLDYAEGKVLGITREAVATKDWEDAGSIGRALLDELIARENAPRDAAGIPTGYRGLDRLLNGLRKQQLLILAARPRMGKSALAMNIAQNFASQGHRVGFLSLEMSKSQLLTRLYAGIGFVNLGHLLNGTLSRAEWSRLLQAQVIGDELPIHIDDAPGLSLREVRARALRLKRDHPDLALLVVDYLGIMAAPNSKMNEQQAVAENAQGLKNLAKELDLPVLALAQLNRSCEQRPDKRPMLSDLRSSGGVEQAADVVLFIFRDVVYNAMTAEPCVGEVIVAKQREGREGTVKLLWMGEYTRFEDPAF